MGGSDKQILFSKLKDKELSRKQIYFNNFDMKGIKTKPLTPLKRKSLVDEKPKFFRVSKNMDLKEVGFIVVSSASTLLTLRPI